MHQSRQLFFLGPLSSEGGAPKQQPPTVVISQRRVRYAVGGLKHDRNDIAEHLMACGVTHLGRSG